MARGQLARPRAQLAWRMDEAATAHCLRRWPGNPALPGCLSRTLQILNGFELWAVVVPLLHKKIATGKSSSGRPIFLFDAHFVMFDPQGQPAPLLSTHPVKPIKGASTNNACVFTFGSPSNREVKTR